MKFYNNNSRFGDAGPYEADSAGELADGMREAIDAWAREKRIEAYDDDALGGMGWQEWLDKKKVEMRAEFIRGLEEV